MEQRLASIRAEIARAERALERYWEAVEYGKLSPERCEHRLTRLQARLDEEPRVNGRHEILPTYRLITPTVCAMSEKVEAAGSTAAKIRYQQPRSRAGASRLRPTHLR